MVDKVKIGFTLGDPGGVGEEIFSKFLQSATAHNIEAILVDDLQEFKQVQKNIELGKSSAISGEYCYKVLKQANEAALKEEFDYLITGPVSKESLWLANHRYSGQTELLAALNDLSRDEIEMFFIAGDLRVVLATRHLPLKDVPEILELRFEKVLTNSKAALKKIWGIGNPKIAVAGLNPHAGENGIIGTEEIQLKKLMVDAEGPFAADALFANAAQRYLHKQEQNYDLLIAAYHDQVLPVIKGIAGFEAINLTAGLPYIRVSVDHGTGFDIVGQNKANFIGLTACTKFCLEHYTNSKYFVKTLVA